ncbi:MAG: methanogenesis marker 16 metalloprotein [Methanobrevibacter sp.]|uniref:methanogenesis marker 16 metalloprotein n=1 Tax=Methanobrevibacter sp. TaxID=66852 RepID=UPI0026DF3ECB|nr:methanogenesis marker 16 metalloprotein [Methanobrevibacter sp.]MDO5848727.1 methanogenesis marker 16 metalloprotein [Methanobrevibacter sp.]
MQNRTIEEINKKIENDDCNIYTAEEFKNMIENDEAPEFDEVDVITTGTCGVMSGTAAVFNIIVAEQGSFVRAKNIYLNGVPGNVGPCPNERLGSVDLIVNGTSKAINDSSYGGGFLFKEILEGKDIEVMVETIDGEIIESTTNISEIPNAQLFGTRMAFKNYTAFTNPSNQPVSSIFSAIPLEGPFSGLTFSGCGDLNPLQNDPNQNIIKFGTKILLNGAEGLVIGNGTRSTSEKPNLMLTGNLKEMDSTYIGGFKTGEGGEVYDTVAVPIPVLNEEIYNGLLVQNKDIPLTVADIDGRFPIGEMTYGDAWGNYDLRPRLNRTKCDKCNDCSVEDICPTNALYDKRIDQYRCFGCGICAHYCRKGAIKMNTGSVNLEIEDNEYDIPIICRQSDVLRGNKLSSKLKKMIMNKEFLL